MPRKNITVTVSPERKVYFLEKLGFKDVKPDGSLFCFHCDSEFKVSEIRTYTDGGSTFVYMSCPSIVKDRYGVEVPCNGTPMFDWSARPWWREEEPDESFDEE